MMTAGYSKLTVTQCGLVVISRGECKKSYRLLYSINSIYYQGTQIVTVKINNKTSLNTIIIRIKHLKSSYFIGFNI